MHQVPSETPMSNPFSPSSKVPVTGQGPTSFAKIRKQIGEMEHMKFGFGKGMANKIIHQFRSLLDGAVNLEDPDTMRLVKKCSNTYSFFSKWSQKSHILWIKEHIYLRLSMMRMLSSKDHGYTMGEVEIETWIASVFFCIKKVAKRLFASLPNPQETSFDLQTVIDALYDLIEVMKQEPCRQGKFHKYYIYLVYLSQRACLPPSVLILNASIHVNQDSVPGIGASADVFRCNLDGRLVAAKTFRTFKYVKKRDKQKFLKEAIHLRLVPHPHIVPCLGIVMSETMLRIITPWMENGDIVNYTKKQPSVSKKDLLEQVTDGLHFLQQYKLVHGDLKGSNVLITDDGKACISDLGASRLLEASTQNTTFKYNWITTQPFILPGSQNPLNLSNLTSLSGMSNLSSAGTYRYMSPERFLPEIFGRDTSRATFSSDVFSFGMLVYEVYAGYPPFHDIRHEATAVIRIANGQRPMRPKCIEDEVWFLATRCWNELPEERPDIFEVYSTLAILP